MAVTQPIALPSSQTVSTGGFRPLGDRLLLLDLDSNLEQPDGDALKVLREQLDRCALGILSGRSLPAARQRFGELLLPEPKVWITGAGTEIHYGQESEPDLFWSAQIGVDWDRAGVESALADLTAHIELQRPEQQGSFKLSYTIRDAGEEILPLIRQRLRQRHQAARPQLRCHWFLDVLPLRASRSEAIRFLALRWGLPLEQMLVVASEQGDGELVSGRPATVVLGDHDPCLDDFRQQQRVYFASRSQLPGVLEGIQHYRFLGGRARHDQSLT